MSGASQANARVGDRGSAELPPLASEQHSCPACGLDYSLVTIDDAISAITTVPTEAREVVAAIPEAALRRRPNLDTWSATEYVCHLRDVFVVYTIRLHRARTEAHPVLEPMLNDLRARRFRYNDLNVHAVLRELENSAAGFCDEAQSLGPQDWDRSVRRLPGEVRTARWLARQAMHEGRHHVRDIYRLGYRASETMLE